MLFKQPREEESESVLFLCVGCEKKNERFFCKQDRWQKAVYQIFKRKKKVLKINLEAPNSFIPRNQVTNIDFREILHYPSTNTQFLGSTRLQVRKLCNYSAGRFGEWARWNLFRGELIHQNSHFWTNLTNLLSVWGLYSGLLNRSGYKKSSERSKLEFNLISILNRFVIFWLIFEQI